MTLHNCRSRLVHETLNGVNLSSDFRDMRSTKSGSNLWQIWQVFVPWASPYRANGQVIMTVHNYRPRTTPQNFGQRKSVQRLLTCLLCCNFFGQPGSVSKFPPFLWVQLWVGWVGRGYTEISRYFPASCINWVTLVTKIKLLYSLRF